MILSVISYVYTYKPRAFLPILGNLGFSRRIFGRVANLGDSVISGDKKGHHKYILISRNYKDETIKKIHRFS